MIRELTEAAENPSLKAILYFDKWHLHANMLSGSDQALGGPGKVGRSSHDRSRSRGNK